MRNEVIAARPNKKKRSIGAARRRTFCMGFWLFTAAAFVALLPKETLAQGNASEGAWEELVSAAKRDGKVVVAGHHFPDVRKELPARFKARFGIPVEYIGGRTPEVVGRLRTERQAGLTTIDVLLTSLSTIATVLHPEQMLEPLRPALLMPEVLDGSRWKRGSLWFSDPEGKYALRLFHYTRALFHLNTAHAKPAEFRSMKDLLNPKWKGKIAVEDPSESSSAEEIYTAYGEEFFKALYIDQTPAISRDSRQTADWLARGTYAITWDVGQIAVKRLQAEGFPIASIFDLPDAPGIATAGPGHVVVLKNGPNPNAGRLFANWIASREGLEVYSRAIMLATTRKDVDESFLIADTIPKPNVRYFDAQGWDFVVSERQKARKRIKEIWGR